MESCPFIPEFSPDLDAAQAHTVLKKSVKILDKAQNCALLWFGEIMRRELYRNLGFSTMRSYAADELGFSPTCAKATVHSPQGEMELTKAEVEAAREDAQILKPGERNKSTIPPRITRAAGSANNSENLITLCTACHELWHVRDMRNREGNKLELVNTG